MRKARVLLLLLLPVLVGAVGFYGLRSGWFSAYRDTGGKSIAEAPNADKTPANQKGAEGRPTFDIVRAEPDGSIIMAGQSKPGWTVIVESDEKEIGRATADENGEWIIQPDQKLPKGEYSLELSAKSPEGEKTLFSKQRLALSLSDPKTDQPLVALTEEGKATRVLQMSPPRTEIDAASAASPSQLGGSRTSQNAELQTAILTPPRPNSDVVAESAGQIGFASVDYEEAGEKSMLHLNGHANPDARVALYVDNEPAGIATADATGSWSFSGNKQLEGGRHALRADLLEGQGDKVIARAEVDFERRPPTVTAFLDDGSKTGGFYEKASPDSAEQTSRAVLAGSNPAEADQPQTDLQHSGVIIVKQGDTLWHIARKHYGDGMKYTQIFKNNKGQIRDPDWIYPNQRFKLP